MQDIYIIMLLSFLAGITIFVGGLLAEFFVIKNKFIRGRFFHWMRGFGAGIILAAVAFALLPKALHDLSLIWIIFLFLYGTLAFMVFDILIAKLGENISQFISMLLDFLPEALVLGASFAFDPKFGALLALFIAVQNLPEGFNSHLELKKNHKTLISFLILFLLSFTGVCAALLGRILLPNHPHIIAGIMIFASGGILYLMFQDVAPLVKQKGSWFPASGASFGFLAGMIIEKLL